MSRARILLISVAGAIIAAVLTFGIFLLVNREEKGERAIRRAGELLRDLGSRNRRSGVENSRARGLPESVLKENEEGRTKEFVVRVRDWELSQGEEFQTPEPGNVFLVVFVEVENAGSVQRKVSRMLHMSALTADGVEYDAALYFPEPSFEDGPLAPGKVASGKVSFEIPQSAEEFYFVFDPGGSNEPIAFRLK